MIDKKAEKPEGTAGEVRTGTGAVLSSIFHRLRDLLSALFSRVMRRKALSAAILIALIAAIGLLNVLGRERLIVTVGPGERGVVFNRFGGGIADDVLGEGTHFIVPVFQRIFTSRVSRQSVPIERVTADSAEFQDVALWLNIEFRMLAEKLPVLFREYGAKSSKELVDEIITPNANEVTKTIMVSYPISKILVSQPEIKTRLTIALRDTLAQYHLEVIDVDLVNIRLAPEYREIVAKTEFAGYDQKQSEIKLATAKLDAERRLVEAETAKQEKIREAEGIAEYNRIVARQAISRELLEYRKLENRGQAIRKWNGQLPGQIGNVSDWPF